MGLCCLGFRVYGYRFEGRNSQQSLSRHFGFPTLGDVEVYALQCNLDKIPPRLDAPEMHELLHNPPLLRVFQVQFIVICCRDLCLSEGERRAEEEEERRGEKRVSVHLTVTAVRLMQ